MLKLLNFFKNNLLKILVSFLLIFITWYPKLPSVQIPHTWVYIRLEDFFILTTVLFWFLLFVFRRVKFPPKIWTTVFVYWGVGLVSLILSLIFIAPHLANFFPSVAILYYIRHIEYLLLFFVAFSTVRSVKDVRDYLIILAVTVIGFSVYAIGQRYYLDLWMAFPHFFEKYPFCFPSFQTGNEEFAKGIPLCLPKDARITSTFAGHYDLGAYLVLVIPIFAAVAFFIKRRIYRILTFLLTLLSIVVLIFTASRVSFIAYLFGLTVTLILIHRKKFIIPLYILSVVLLLIFSGSTAKRFMQTFSLVSVVINNQGQVVGQATLPSDLKNKVANNIYENVPTQNLPQGSGFLGLPRFGNLKKTNQAIVSSALSIEQARKLKLENGGVEISTVSGSFLVEKVLVYDISFTTRFQAEWPNAWNAMMRDPLFGSGYATITLAADNNYLRILGETGFLGMIAFLSIFFALGLMLKQSFSLVSDKISRGYLVGIVGGIAGLFFNAVLIDVFEASKVAESLWILLGIAVGIIFLYKKQFQYKKNIVRILTSKLFGFFYLIFLMFVFYLKSVGNFFVADDFTWLKWAATTNLPDLPKLFINSQGFFYRPLDKIVVFFLYTFFSFSQQGYHLFTLSIHFLIALGVFILAGKIFKSKLLSFITAFLFLFLPSQGENVFWISTISTTLSTFFIVYLLIFWLNYRNKNSKLNYFLVLLFALCAFLSYEISVVILPLLVLSDIFLTKVKLINIKTWLGYIPLLLLTVLYPFVRIAAHTVPIGGDYSYNLSHLIPNFVGNYLGYLALFIIGEPSLPFYTSARNIFKGDSFYILIFLLLAVFASLVVLFANRKRIENLLSGETVKYVLFSLLFIFVGLLPFLGLGNIAERYGYLSSVGFVILVVLLLSKISTIVRNNNFKLLVLIVLTGLIGSWYYYQNNLENAQWREAGRITNRTLGYIRLYYDGKQSNSHFYFINLPIRKAQAWIFPVGLPDGIWFIYRDESIKIYKMSSISEGKAILKLAKKKDKTYVFAFDKNSNIYEVK